MSMLLLDWYKICIDEVIKKIHLKRDRGYDGVNLQIEFFTNLENYESICSTFESQNEDVNEFFRKSLIKTGMYCLGSDNESLLPISIKNSKISFVKYKKILSKICKKVTFSKENVTDEELYNLLNYQLSISRYKKVTLSDILSSFRKNDESFGDFVKNEFKFQLFLNKFI